MPTELMIVVRHFAVVMIRVGCAEVEAFVLAVRAVRVCGVEISRERTIRRRLAEQINGRINRTGERAIGRARPDRHAFDVAQQRDDAARKDDGVVVVLRQHFRPRRQLRVPVRRLHELRQRFKSIRRGRESVFKDCAMRRQLIKIRAGVLTVAVSAEMIGPQRVDEDIDDVQSPRARLWRDVVRLAVALPSLKVFAREIAADAIVIRAVGDDLCLAWIDVGAAVVQIAAAKKCRVAVAVEIQRPLNQLNMLFGLHSA